MRPPPPVKRSRSTDEDTTPAKRKVKAPEVEETEPETEEAEIEEEEVPSIDVAKIQSQIATLMGYSTFESPEQCWLDTGSPELNGVLGSPDGLPYGRIYELAGEEHGGKTALSTWLAGMAQKDGAGVGYIDLEHSHDELWAAKLGLDLGKTVLVYPKLIVGEKKKKEKKGFIRNPVAQKKENVKVKTLTRFGLAPRLQSGEDMFKEAEAGMALLKQAGFKKQFWFLDSIANLQTEMVVEAGIEGQNMRTKLDRAAFLSMTLPRWAGLAANYNAIIFLINQIRDKQGMVFGKRTYSPGGRALRHACSIRAEVKRKKAVKKSGETIGILGTVINEKNKAGNGSVQSKRCGFKIVWSKNPARVTFLTADEMEEEQ